MIPKLSQNQKSELKEVLKIKVVHLYELTQKNRPLGPQKVKNDPKIKSKSKVRIEGTIENKSCSTALGKVSKKKKLVEFSTKRGGGSERPIFH